ncbi:hypothetical protein [Fodinicola feengrottensis]|uniref:hypothetical protein n=1 Tax=Fodinicola feengrottensis TaxID=435914 RepID=UPI0013D39E9C|nr:hypothetical protein [Fodinicola feengrottensis]
MSLPDTQESATETLLRESFAAPARTPLVPVDPRPAILALDRRQRRRFLAVFFVAVVVIILAAVGIPAVTTALSADPAAVALEAPAAGSGLLPWAPRGDRVTDKTAIAVAERSWVRRAEADPAVRDVHLLYANTSSEGVWVVLQGIDKNGQPTAAQIRYAAGGAFVEWAAKVPKPAPLAIYLPDGLLATRLLFAPGLAASKVTLREDGWPAPDAGPSAGVAADGLSQPVPLATEMPSNDPFDFDVSGDPRRPARTDRVRHRRLRLAVHHLECHQHQPAARRLVVRRAAVRPDDLPGQGRPRPVGRTVPGRGRARPVHAGHGCRQAGHR